MSSSKKTKDNGKGKYANKVKYAMESPEPVFDLSNCSMKTIPPGTFALLNSLNKEALYLQKNQLTNFGSDNLTSDLTNLKILDISFNKFTKLPPGLEELIKLEILKVNDNSLEVLPFGIGNLKNLIHLDVSTNHLKILPSSLGNCTSIQELYLKNNKLTELPMTLGRLKNLEQLEVDHIVHFPPQEIISQGTRATLQFLAQELEAHPGKLTSSSSAINHKNFEDEGKLLEKKKEEKKKDMLALEQQIKANAQKEAELHQEMKGKKSELVQTIKNEKDYLVRALSKVQERKGAERESLIKLCIEEEKVATDAISKILKNNKRFQNELLATFNKQMKEHMEISDKDIMPLNDKEKKQVLESMDEIMKREIKKFHDLNTGKNVHTIKSVLANLENQTDVLEEMFKKFDKSQKELIKALKNNEILQKSAVASLLEKNDATSWALRQQIIIIEQKLIELTRLELSKKKLESDQLMAELNRNRIALTKALLDLFDQQELRRLLLIETIRTMEMGKSESQNGQNYWLEQFKNILDSKSTELIKSFDSFDPVLVNKFFEFGVFQYLPSLKDFVVNDEELKKLNNKVLSELGVDSEEDKKNIAHAIEAYFTIKNPRKQVPSAPPEEIEQKSTSSSSATKVHFNFIVPEECVICLDLKPNIVFLPCGHVCCCVKCYSLITSCPICRTTIETPQKILFSE